MDPLEATRRYLANHPDIARDMSFLISHDPASGKRAAHQIFVGCGRLFIVKKQLADSVFKCAYLVEEFDKQNEQVLTITKEAVGLTSSEILIGEYLIENPIEGAIHTLDIFTMNNGSKALLYVYYNGGDLLNAIMNRTLDDEQKVVIGKHLIAALQRVHDSGLIHRDIKPANILFSRTEDAITDVVLADFGEGALPGHTQAIHNIEHYFSSPEAEEVLAANSRALTRWYAAEKGSDRQELDEALKECAPLIAELKSVTTAPAFDIWMLGLTLWCLFKGKTHRDFPWQHAVEDLNYKKNSQEKIAFAKKPDLVGIPAPFDQLIADMIAVDPEERKLAL